MGRNFTPQDQDHWWMAGIHRPVDILRRPTIGASMVDFRVQGDADGRLSISADVELSSVGYSVVATLYDDEQIDKLGGRRSGNSVWSKVVLLQARGPSESAGLGKKYVETAEVSDIVCNGAPRQWTAEAPNLYLACLKRDQLDRGGHPSLRDLNL